MTQLPFSFGNALMHFSKVNGPAGFLWKFGLVFALVALVLQVVSIWLQWPMYELYFRIFTEGEVDFVPYADDIMAASMRSNLAALFVMPLGALLWMVFEGASQRRYMRDEGFSLRVSADEWRLLLVGLIWIGLLIGAYIGFAIMLIIPVIIAAAGGESGIWAGALLGFVMLLGYLVFLLWASARLSAAGSLTIRDEQIRFFESWKVTKGKAWTIVGAWVILGFIVVITFVVMYAVIIGVAAATLGTLVPDFFNGQVDTEEVLRAMASPVFWLPVVLIGLVMVFLQGIFQHISGARQHWRPGQILNGRVIPRSTRHLPSWLRTPFSLPGSWLCAWSSRRILFLLLPSPSLWVLV